MGTEVSERKGSLVTRKTSTTTSTMEQTSITSTKRRKSVIMQCNVTGDHESIKIDWSKDGQELQRSDQTVVQLEIMEASIDDKGSYELVATSTEGEKQSQTVVLTEEAVVASLAAQPDEADGPKKKKKKIVKKKKKKEEA